jgi:hypothetical protein
MSKEQVLKEFQIIPSVGKACALDLWNIGLRSVADLKGQNPAELYARLNAVSGVQHNICMLYTFRCAVYYASEREPKPEQLKWWYWKDKQYNEGDMGR